MATIFIRKLRNKNSIFFYFGLKTKGLLATILICLIVNLSAVAQNIGNDTISNVAKSDTSLIDKNTPTATAPADTTAVADSTAESKPKSKKQILTSDVKTSATDSTIFSIDGKKVFLFGDAKIEFEDIELTAAYIEADMDQGIIYAEGVTDSLGNIEGQPVFKQGSDEMKAINLTYNVNTKRGYIERLYTEQEDGYLHSELTKKEADNTINMIHGKYTTCELEDPHFYLELTKGKYIPDKAIIAGPSYMVLADIPLPLVIPFGYFPITKTRTSGFIMPRVGEENNRGFYLSDGGYYFAGNDYMDLTLKGSMYSKGSWSANVTSRYRLRYKFSGNVNLTYAKTIAGEKGLSDYVNQNQYSIRWTHSQDAKARPNSTFSASVNFSSSQYNKYNTTASQDYLTNTTSSSISYQLSKILNSPFSVSANLQHTQNTRDSSISLTLPNFTLTMSRIQPFKRKNGVGRARWYEDIGFSYSGTFRNTVKTHIDSLFRSETLDKFVYGAKHSPTISKSFKVLKYFNFSPSVTYGERWYFTRSFIEPLNDTTPISKTNYSEREETGFYRVYDYSFGAGVNTTLYGMFLFKKGPVKALRHVVTPSVSYSWRPDFGQEKYGFFEVDPRDTTGKSLYSPYRYGIYGVPGKGKSGTVSFSLGNKLEMKVKDKNDTVNHERKVALLESFNLSTSYNTIAEEFKWSDLSMSAKTTLFKTLGINVSARGNFYAIDSLGKRIEVFEHEVSGRPFRLTNVSMSTGYSIDSDKLFGKKDKNKKADDDEDDIDAGEYDYFDMSWSVNFSYSLSYSKPGKEGKLSQSLSFSGDFSLTPQWKIGYSSGFDFDSKSFTYTRFSLSRDLHCWAATLSLIPFGARQSYSFSIAVKSAVLQDLKYNKNRSWYDN